MNHSFNNKNVSPYHFNCDTRLQTCYATQDVNKDEELLINYGKSYGYKTNLIFLFFFILLYIYITKMSDDTKTELSVSEENKTQSTQVFQFELKEIDNVHLANAIFKREAADKKKWNYLENLPGRHPDYHYGIFASNRGGYHSPYDLFKTTKDKVLSQLHDEILKCVKKLLNRETIKVKSSWANVNRPGHYNAKHNHHIPVVGVYYVKTDTTIADPGGELMICAENIKITPKAGMLLVFPGRTQHEVLKYKGTSPRISIAMNFSV